MHQWSVSLSLIVSASILAGCATPYLQGRTALQQGRYDEAATYFERVLAGEPGRLDALAGLGVARYKLGAFDEAVDTLHRVVTHAPKRADARLYLGLNYLRKGEDGLAEAHLTGLLDLKPHPRLAAQIERALRVIRVKSAPLRGDAGVSGGKFGGRGPMGTGGPRSSI